MLVVRVFEEEVGGEGIVVGVCLGEDLAVEDGEFVREEDVVDRDIEVVLVEGVVGEPRARSSVSIGEGGGRVEVLSANEFGVGVGLRDIVEIAEDNHRVGGFGDNSRDAVSLRGTDYRCVGDFGEDVAERAVVGLVVDRVIGELLGNTTVAHSKTVRFEVVVEDSDSVITYFNIAEDRDIVGGDIFHLNLVHDWVAGEEDKTVGTVASLVLVPEMAVFVHTVEAVLDFVPFAVSVVIVAELLKADNVVVTSLNHIEDAVSVFVFSEHLDIVGEDVEFVALGEFLLRGVVAAEVKDHGASPDREREEEDYEEDYVSRALAGEEPEEEPGEEGVDDERHSEANPGDFADFFGVDVGYSEEQHVV